MSSPTQSSPVNSQASTSSPIGPNGRRTSFGAGNDGAGGGYYKSLEKKRRGSQSHADTARDMLKKDTFGDAWSNLFK